MVCQWCAFSLEANWRQIVYHCLYYCWLNYRNVFYYFKDNVMIMIRVSIIILVKLKHTCNKSLVEAVSTLVDLRDSRKAEERMLQLQRSLYIYIFGLF